MKKNSGLTSRHEVFSEDRSASEKLVFAKVNLVVYKGYNASKDALRSCRAEKSAANPFEYVVELRHWAAASNHGLHDDVEVTDVMAWATCEFIFTVSDIEVSHNFSQKRKK